MSQENYTAISQRIQNLSVSATIAMAKKGRELASQGVSVIKLSFGEPDFNTPTHIKEAAQKAIEENFTFYTPVPGIPALREAIAHKLQRDNGLKWSADNIVVSTGAKQSLANALLSLVDPGDEVIVFSPYWVTYAEIIKLAEGRPVFVKGALENNFKVTPDQLKSALSDKTKVVLYSSPSNPTGTMYSKEELEAFAKILENYPKVHVIADEIYEYIRFVDDYYSMGAIESIADRVVTVNGFSKGFAMTGWRVGYLAANQKIVQACDKLQGQFTSGTCAISQKAALAAISGDLTPTHDMTKVFLKRRALVLSLMQDIEGFKTPTPDGAFYVFPDISAYFGRRAGEHIINNSTDFCFYLLNEAHVALVPGIAFGDDNCFRFSFAASDEDITRAIGNIKTALKKLN